MTLIDLMRNLNDALFEPIVKTMAKNFDNEQPFLCTMVA